jgi:hypothetical protein
MPFREEAELVLGRGEVFFEHAPSGATGEGEVYFGNTPSFQITRSVERMESYRSYLGQKHQFRGRVISERVEIRLATDNMAWDNIALWFGGNDTISTAGDEFIPFEDTFVAKRGRFYQIGMTNSPAGFYYIDRIVVTMGGETLVAGLHYEFERDVGRIQILTSAPVAVEGQTISVKSWKRQGKVKYLAVEGKETYGALRYIAQNPYGVRTDYWFPKVRIAPQGALEMKGDEFQQMLFNVTAIRKSPVMPLLFVMQSGEPPRPITADTTLITADSTAYSADEAVFERRI